MTDKVERLIDYFVPDHYDLSLTLNRSERTFEGTVVIKGEARADTIKLHAKDLEIHEVSVDGSGTEFSLGENDSLVISGRGSEVRVKFVGKITDGMHGLYPCYFEHDGVKKELLGTQFESHHAREVFPCVDEPLAKATFDLHLDTETDVTVLGNMPVRSQNTEANRMVTDFDTTPRMSTYLLAFVVGEMHSKTAKTKDGVDVSVWSTVAQPDDNLDFALEMSVRLLEYFEEYFGIPYPLPKCDHVALPDFSSGAMENWGLITYREVTLLADPEATSISGKYRIAAVIAHELSHQWFGNLVTMSWWDELWLNESFAEMMMHFAVDALEPDWNMWLDFATHVSVSALRRDCVDGVQPVKMDVNHPDEMNTIFDPSIVYAKGSRLILMARHLVGEEAFQKGLRQYFKDHAYGSTTGDDLWNALGEASGKHVADIMNAWLSQPGYPVVKITRDGDNITLHQERFFVGPHEASDQMWPIPLDSDCETAPEIFDQREVTFHCPNPIWLNMSDSAHFITNYDDKSRQALIDKIEDNSLPPIGRLQRLTEASLNARGGNISSDKLLPVIHGFHNEPLESVWTTVSITLAELRKFVEDNEAAEKKLRDFSAYLAHEEYQRLGWDKHDGETEEDTRLRSTIIAMTLYGEDADALATARKIYEEKGADKLEPELRPAILSSVTRYGNDKIVDELLETYRYTTTAELREDICIGITSTCIPEKIDYLLDQLKDSELIRKQDVYHWFAFLIRGRESRTATWEWVRNNWDWVERTFKGDKSYDDVPRYTANALSTRQQLDEYREFFGPMKADPALTRTIEMGITEIEGRVELIERDKDAVQNALLEQNWLEYN